MKHVNRWIVLLFILLMGSLYAEAQTVGATIADFAPVYDGPGQTYTALQTIAPGTRVLIRERNQIGNWLRISWQEGSRRLRGWVMIGYVTLPDDFKLSEITVFDIPDIKEQTTGITAALYNIPILSEIHPEMCEIYGRTENPGVISKVGDSNSVSERYLAPIEETGPYDFLAETADYFNGSLGSTSAAARVGMNSASVFDPMWSNRSLCEDGETPLACEYRRAEPAVAVIMFGANDTRALNAEDYETSMRQLIEETLDTGIIPVLVTFTTNPELGDFQAVRFNEITASLAGEYHVPLINFWAAARALPRAGLGEDNVHLTQSGNQFTLGHDESFYGLPLHNLLVLHVLNGLRECEPSDMEILDE